MAYMGCIVMACIAMAYMGCIVMVYIAMAYMGCIVMAYIAMAYMGCIVMVVMAEIETAIRFEEVADLKKKSWRAGLCAP